MLRAATGSIRLSPSGSIDSNAEVTPTNSPSLARKGRDFPVQPGTNWTPWKTGMAFSYRGHTLMVMKQAVNMPSDKFLETWQGRVKLLESRYRIEVHIYTNEWVKLTNELVALNAHSGDFEAIPGLATKLLIMVTTHVKALALNWFSGMLRSSSSNVTYIPCWKCYAEIGCSDTLNRGN